MSNSITGKVTEEQLMPCQVTYKGIDYSPITHKQVIEGIDEYLYKNNFKVKGKQYLAGSFGQMAIGKIFIDYPDSECGYTVAWKNSLNGAMSFGLASGMHTFICSNGSVYGDVSSYKRKHSGNATNEIEAQIRLACERLEETMEVQIGRREIMKEREISKKSISELCGRLYMEDEIIQATQLSIIKKELENPSYNYGAPGSVWDFYSHCTHAIKETAPLIWHKKHQQLGDFFVNEFGLIIKKEEVLELV